MKRSQTLLPIYISSGTARVDLTINAVAGDFKDKVTRPVSVKPRGFPIEIAADGMLSSAKPFTRKLANLTEAMERLMCEP